MRPPRESRQTTARGRSARGRSARGTPVIAMYACRRRRRPARTAPVRSAARSGPRTERAAHPEQVDMAPGHQQFEGPGVVRHAFVAPAEGSRLHAGHLTDWSRSAVRRPLLMRVISSHVSRSATDEQCRPCGPAAGRGPGRRGGSAGAGWAALSPYGHAPGRTGPSRGPLGQEAGKSERGAAVVGRARSRAPAHVDSAEATACSAETSRTRGAPGPPVRRTVCTDRAHRRSRWTSRDGTRRPRALLHPRSHRPRRGGRLAGTDAGA